MEHGALTPTGTWSIAFATPPGHPPSVAGHPPRKGEGNAVLIVIHMLKPRAALEQRRQHDMQLPHSNR